MRNVLHPYKIIEISTEVGYSHYLMWDQFILLVDVLLHTWLSLGYINHFFCLMKYGFMMLNIIKGELHIGVFAFDLFCRSWEQQLMFMLTNIRNVLIASLTCWQAVTGGISFYHAFEPELSKIIHQLCEICCATNLLIHACGYLYIRNRTFRIPSVVALNIMIALWIMKRTGCMHRLFFLISLSNEHEIETVSGLSLTPDLRLHCVNTKCKSSIK